MKKIILLILLSISVSTFSYTITSLNLEWFGRGGIKEGTLEDEYRGKRIHHFLTKEIPYSDILVFQEVTSPALIKKLFKSYHCYDYDNEIKRHQYVMICLSKNLDSQYSPYKFTIKSVQLNNPKLRPALAVSLQLSFFDELTIIGVHLKAGPKNTETRLKQIKELTQHLNGTQGDTIVIGDFNTFPKERTKLEKNDEEYMNEIFNQLGLKYTTSSETPTYLWKENRVFDRAWSTFSIHYQKVYGPCVKDSVSYPYNSVQFYKRFISDHCAIQVQY